MFTRTVGDDGINNGDSLWRRMGSKIIINSEEIAPILSRIFGGGRISSQHGRRFEPHDQDLLDRRQEVVILL